MFLSRWFASVVPDIVRIPVYIVLIASVVALLQLLMQPFTQAFLASDIYSTYCSELYNTWKSRSLLIKTGGSFSLRRNRHRHRLHTLSTTRIIRELLETVRWGKLGSGDGVLAFVLAPELFSLIRHLMVLFNV